MLYVGNRDFSSSGFVCQETSQPERKCRPCHQGTFGSQSGCSPCPPGEFAGNVLLLRCSHTERDILMLTDTFSPRNTIAFRRKINSFLVFVSLKRCYVSSKSFRFLKIFVSSLKVFVCSLKHIRQPRRP